MIPKIAHFIWLGDKSVPTEYISRFHDLHPEWTVRTWKDGDYSWLRNHDLFQMVPTAQKADVLRYEILFRYGGVYLDVDVEALKSFDPLLDRPLLIARESAGTFGTAVIGSDFDNLTLAKIMVAMPISYEMNRGKHSTDRVGPNFVTSILDGEVVDPVPTEFFYPYPWNDKERPAGETYPDSYAVHRWWGLGIPTRFYE